MKSFAQLLEDYLAQCRLRGMSHHKINNLRTSIGVLVHWLATQAHVATPDQFRGCMFPRWYQQLSSRRKKSGLPLRATTVWKYAQVTQTFCRWLVRQGHLPAAALREFPELRQPRFVRYPALKHREARQLLRALPLETDEDYLLRTLAELLYSTGVRIAEALAVNVGDIDFEAELVRVTGKGQKERMIPVGRTALRWLQNYVQGVRLRLLRSPDQRALWLGCYGQRLGYYMFLRRWRRVRQLAPVNFTVTALTFRRSFATELIRNGASLWAVKEMLGHEDFSNLKHYTDLTLDDLRKTHARCHPRESVTISSD